MLNPFIAEIMRPYINMSRYEPQKSEMPAYKCPAHIGEGNAFVMAHFDVSDEGNIVNLKVLYNGTDIKPCLEENQIIHLEIICGTWYENHAKDQNDELRIDSQRDSNDEFVERRRHFVGLAS